MRIAFDATAAPPQPVGAGNYILYMAQALSLLGEELDLVVYAQKTGAQRLKFPDSHKIQLIVQPDRSPAGRLVWEQVCLPSLLRKDGIDLLHSPHYTLPILFTGPVIVTIHDLTIFRFPHLHLARKRLFFRTFIYISARRAAALIAVSESTRQDILQFVRISPSKIHTVHEGVSTDFHPIRDDSRIQTVRSRYDLPQDFILFVGLIEPRKNLPVLLRAVKMASNRHETLHLVITGRPGWKYEEVYQLIEQLDLKSRITFTGYIPHDDLPVLYNMSRFLVYPSQYEGFGLPVLEAMACGTPVLTTQVSSMPEITGEVGLLVPPGDVDALAHGIERLWQDPTQCHKMSVQGVQRASGFSWERAARQTLDVYRHVLR